jgi:hypothetical protein
MSVILMMQALSAALIMSMCGGRSPVIHVVVLSKCRPHTATFANWSRVVAEVCRRNRGAYEVIQRPPVRHF